MELPVLILVVVAISALYFWAEKHNNKNSERQKYLQELSAKDKDVYEKNRQERRRKAAEAIDRLTNECIDTHIKTLAQKRRQLLVKDEWGREVDNGWRLNTDPKKQWNFKETLYVFYFEILYPYLKSNLPFFEHLPKDEDIVQYSFERFESYYAVPNFRIWVYDLVDQKCDEVLTTYEAQAVDSMEGVVYEDYCQTLLLTAGWEARHTKASGDQGVDLIAEIEDIKVCIQCKRYNKPVGNKAVQEVLAGKVFYGGTHAVVVSNAGFTKAAKSLAESADVILISDTELEDLETMV